MKYLFLCGLLAGVAAQPLGVMVPPHNWRYTVGDASCTPVHCSVQYNIDPALCQCGQSQVVDRQITSCLPHCGSDCYQCTLHFPAKKKLACGRNACTDAEWSSLQHDCVMSNWTEWSGCTKPCRDKFGPGLQYRRQHVVQPSRNGGTPCPDAMDQYQEQICNNQTCTEPIQCHANPYCAGSMETCENVACRVVEHDRDGLDGQDYTVNCVDDGYGSVSCTDPANGNPVQDVHFLPDDADHPNCATVNQYDTSGATLAERAANMRPNATHNNGCAGSWYAAAGKYHIEVVHRSWDPAGRHQVFNHSAWPSPPHPVHNHTANWTRENDGAKHFCRLHYPFGLKKPTCKCMCADETQAIEQCNYERTKCHLVATSEFQNAIDGLPAATGTGVSLQFPSWSRDRTVAESFQQGVQLSDTVDPALINHANNLKLLPAQSIDLHDAEDYQAAEAARNDAEASGFPNGS